MSRNYRPGIAVPQPKNGGERLLNRPKFAPFEGPGHLGLHPRANFAEAAARSTFQPATL